MKKTLIILIAFWSQINFAQTLLGDYFTYQGELLVNGQVANGNYEFEAQFYDASTNGNNIANNFNIAATVTDGIFTLQLDIGGGAFEGDEVWIELLVTPPGGGTQVSLLPRQLITNSPYSIQAKYVGNDGVSTLSIVNAAVTTSKLANAAVTSAKLAGDSVTSAKIVNGTIETVDISSQAVTRVQIAANTIQRSEVDSTQIQERVTGTCAAGSSIRVIAQDGSVTCEADDTGAGSAGWGLTGNAGTTPGTNFIGTTDNKLLEFKVNNLTSMKIIPKNVFGDTTPNIIFGGSSNTISFDIVGALIGAGKNNSINSNSSESNIIISGGYNNSISNVTTSITGAVISGGDGNSITDGSYSTISGGSGGVITKAYAVIAGGRSNKALGNASVVPGGTSNVAGGRYSFAAGQGAIVRDSTQSGTPLGDEGTFVWSSESSFFTSTAPKQFLIEANGGVGIGTNAPSSPLHIKGQGTTLGTIVDEVVMAIEPKTTADNVSLAINKLGTSQESALVFAISNEPEFDIRTSSTVTRSMIDFNSYDNLGNPTFMLRINDKATNRIDFNAHIEPQVGNTFNIGSESFRWSTIYAQNPLNTPSDERLKQDIKDMSYGLAEVLAMRPVTYHWKKGDTKRVNLGLIAQEVEIIVPEIVQKTDDEKQTRSMRYAELIPVLIKATQEQQVLIEQQQTSIQQQSKEITELKSMLKSILAANKTTK